MDVMNETSEAVGSNTGTEQTAKASRSKFSRRKASKPTKAQREQSTIAFPYRDLELGISVAQAILNAGGVPLTSEQLAGVMNLAVGSGNFVMKVATARTFGLIANAGGKYELTNIGFAIVDKDEKRQRQARAESFLSVPLYRRVYDEFRGRQLPPRPHGLEQAFVKFGVSSKQKNVARLAFERSATQAGFFAAGADRLIEPIIAGPLPTTRSAVDDNDRGVDGDGRRASVEMSGSDVSGFHPFIQGLLDRLPESDTTWTIEGRAKWLQAAAHCFDLIYKGNGNIEIKVKSSDDRTEDAAG